MFATALSTAANSLSVTDYKTRQVRPRGFPHHFNVSYASIRRPSMAPGYRLVHHVALAVKDNFDTSVGQISDPPVETERTGHISRGRAEEDPLHAARYP